MKSKTKSLKRSRKEISKKPVRKVKTTTRRAKPAREIQQAPARNRGEGVAADHERYEICAGARGTVKRHLQTAVGRDDHFDPKVVFL